MWFQYLRRMCLFLQIHNLKSASAYESFWLLEKLPFRKAMFRQVWIHALSLYNLSGRNGQPFLLINIMQKHRWCIQRWAAITFIGCLMVHWVMTSRSLLYQSPSPWKQVWWHIALWYSLLLVICQSFVTYSVKSILLIPSQLKSDYWKWFFKTIRY